MSRGDEAPWAPFLESSPGSLWRSWPWRSPWRGISASVRVGRPPQIFAQWVGASEASRHRPSQPGNQALTRDLLCAPTLALLRTCAEEPGEAVRMPQGSCGWCSPPPGWGPLPPALPMGGGGPRPHTHTLPPPGRLSEALDVQEPGQGRAPTPTGLPLADTQQTLELLLASVLSCPCPGVGGRVCGEGPALSWTGGV